MKWGESLSIFMYGVLVAGMQPIARAQDQGFSPMLEGGKTGTQYFDAAGAPDISKKNHQFCLSRLVGGYCQEELRNEKGITIRAFSELEYTIELSTVTRFRHYAYGRLLAKRKSDNFKTDKLVDDSGRDVHDLAARQDRIFLSTVEYDLANIFTGSGGYVQAYSDGIYIDATLHLKAPAKLRQVVFGNDLQGDVALIARDSDHAVWVSDLKTWVKIDTEIPWSLPMGENVTLSPGADGKVYVVYQKTENPFSKGLVLVSVNMASGEKTQGWLFLSEDTYLSKPAMFVDQGMISVSAYDYGRHSMVHGDFREDSVKDLSQQVLIERYADAPRRFEFGASAGLFDLHRGERTRGVARNVNLTAEYAYPSTLFHSVGAQAGYRGFGVRADLTQNTRDPDNNWMLAASASVDAVPFFPSLTALRVGASTSRYAGRVTFSDNTAETPMEGRTDAVYARAEKERFSYELSYTRRRAPAAVWVGDLTQNLSLVGYDPGLVTNVVRLGAGYDTLAQERRILNRLNRFYFAGNAGLGIGKMAMSSVAKSDFEQRLNLVVPSSGLLQLDIGLDVGYIVQRRKLAWKGAEFALMGGYRWRRVSINEGASTGNVSGPRMESSLRQTWQGPYLEFGASF